MFFDLCSKFLSFAVSAAAILAGMSVLLLVALALPKTFLRESAQTARALSGLCRRQPVVLGVFVLFAVVLSLHVGGKGERSPLAMFPGGFLSSPSFCGVPPTVSELPVNAPHGAVPYEAFSNLHVSAFSATTTNVCLSASWYPLTNGVAVLDVYSSTDLLDGVWLPQAAVEVDAADTNAVFTLPLDWFGTPAALFLRLGSRFDFDGDGLPDAFEKWTCETDATIPDSDSDGLSDGEELRLGTDPLLADTDGDGLPDGEEDGPPGYTVTAGTFDPVPTCMTNLLAGGGSVDDRCFSVALPFAVTVFNIAATNLVIDSNGLVYLTRDPSFSPAPEYRNCELPGPLSGDAVCIAPFWDDLCDSPDTGTPELNVGWLCTNGVSYAVIEFRDFSFYRAETTNDFVSFRLVLSDARPNDAWIFYDRADGLGRGSSATFGGCQCAAPFTAVNVGDIAGTVTAGTFLELHLTGRSSPLLADTDGDGLGDGAEVLLGTSPVAPDTDGDSLHDGWEHQNGLDPLSGDSPGQSALETDADDDGLSLWEECQYGTSPDNGSTFGIPDGDYVDNGMRPSPPDDYVEVPVSIGDPSGSESERWAITVAEQGNSYRQYKVTSDSYGTVKTRNLRLARGGKYAITVSHIASNQSDGPDYDWKAQIGNLPDNRVLPRGVTHSDSSRWFSVPEIGAVADNRDGLLGTCDQSFGDENNTTGKKVYLYIPKADLVGYAALRGSEDREVPEEERFDPGYLVMGTGTADTDAMPAKVKFAKLESGFALSRYMRFSEAGRIKARGSYGWAVAGTTDEIAIPGNVDVDAYRKLAINSIADWPDGTTHVDVEYIVRDRDGELLTASTNRLLRPYLIACGNSLTWGLRRRADRVLETPQWESPWFSYPGEAEWLAKGLPPANRFLKAYQGYRGYLAEKLPGVTWLGLDTNGHGPPHLGFPGAKASQIYKKMGDHASLFTKENCYQVVVYCAGMNDCTGSATAEAIANDWRLGVATNDFMRTDKGRTLFVALKVPEVTSVYSPNGYQAVNQKLSAVNASMEYVSENPFFKFVLGDTAQINHANDDGLHFSDVGYGIMADRIYSAITEGLHDD